MELLKLFYCKTVYSEISTTNYNGELNKYGDQITFKRAPEITVRNYEKGGPLIRQNISSELVTMTIDRGKYFDVHIDDIDKREIQQWGSFETAILERGSYNLATQIDTELMTEMFADVDPNNSGINAGVISHSYNLGVTGNPVPLSSSNIVQVLSNVKATLKEQCAWNDNDMPYIVLPEIAEPVLLNSDLKAAYLTGEDKSPILNGRLPSTIMGFNIYFNNFVPHVFDVGVGSNCFNIVAGVQSATAFASQIEYSEVVPSLDTFGQDYRALNVYGFKVLQPKAIAALYAKFN